MSYPTTFGKYLLLERINVGGMAEVFKAKAFGVEGFERILAIKRILPNMADDEEFINMFIDEARIAVQLSHANVVPIYELGKFENQYYIAMEYVPGRDLRQVLDRFRKRDQTLPIPAAAFITSKICEGLDYAHRKADASGRPMNLIHRDVSPQNILVSYEGSVKITDFGIVKAEDRASKTQAGVLKGKFGYMSPEQVRGLEIDSRSDIFAVGILLYEMVTGKRLFIGESDFSTLEKVRNAEVVPPSQHNPAVSEAFEAVMLKALARERDERYGSAAELHDDLQQFLIEDNTVFTSKRLAALMKEEYAEEIHNDLQKMEEFMRLPPPTSQEALVAHEHLAAPTGDWSADARAEKTVIFESGFADDMAEAQTLIAQEGALGPLPPRAADESSVSQGGHTSPDPPVSPPRRRSFGLVVAVGLLLLASLGAAVGYLVLNAGVGVGTLVVTATPAEEINIFLDGVLIGQKSPLVHANVPVGEHRLLARATGYKDKVYRFDLAAGAPAEIKVDLERSAAQVGDAIVEITSDPDQASVYMGGLPLGVTPYTLHTSDTSHPIILEVGKPGYTTRVVTVMFGPNEKRKTLHVKLLAVGAPPPGQGGEGKGSPAKLFVRSRPERAKVYLGGVLRGTTPLELADLDSRQVYALEVEKDGFRPHEENLRMGGRTTVVLNIDLQREGSRKGKRLGGHDRDLDREGGGGGGGGGSGCGGSGGKLSVMALDVGDCKVTVGKQSLGGAPMFKKDSPVGRCVIEVKCPGGKRYQTTRILRAGDEEKIIIKPDDWLEK
jgi:serine/threonine protein kinase